MNYDAKHTPGAIRAAAIIMGDDASIWTVYGRKTLAGLADLIDRETAAPDLLAALEPLQVWAENERRRHRASNEENEAAFMGELADNARAAIRKAKGKA